MIVLPRRLALSVFLVVAVVSFVSAQTPFYPLRIESQPTIDGVLDDEVWSRAPAVSGFRSFTPDYGKQLAGETEVLMAYDDENLYFAFRCFDPEPSKIKTSITSRDNMWTDDWVCVNLDTFGDQQSLYAIYVNPNGIQGDSRFAGGVESRTVDLVWYSGGTVDEKGYTIEIQLPLKSIRYAETDPVTMGVIFERHISRHREQGTYPPLDPAQGDSWLTQMNPMIYTGLEKQTLLEILPAFTYSERMLADSGKFSVDDIRRDFSLTTKYGITSDLVLDATYNPDFSQVEADAGQVDVNLRFALFYPEKRPFFLEGSENFNIATADFDFAFVHTRTIIDPLVGAKLTGKIGEKNTIATIYAMDELLEVNAKPGEKYAHFAIARYKRSLDKDSFVGGLYAGIERKYGYSRLIGLDGQLRVTEASLLSANAFYSVAQDSTNARVDSGYTFTAQLVHTTRDIDYGAFVRDISRQFRADMGYIPRTGTTRYVVFVTPKIYPGSEILRRIDVGGSADFTKDKFSNLWEQNLELSVRNVLWGGLSVTLDYQYSTEVFESQRFKTGGFYVSGGGQFTNQFSMSLYYRKGKAIYYDPANPYQGDANRVTATAIYQPTGQLKGELNFVYQNFFRESDGERIYDYPITRLKLTYQLNQYLFFRGIGEYNNFRKDLSTDFLASFTYIPGTVIHLGYGSVFDKVKWENGQYLESDRFLEVKRGFFFKASYLWRL